jgi:hypothetical protein
VRLLIHFATMADRDDQHNDPVLLNLTDDSVIPDSVSPEALVGVAQRFAKVLGIVGGRNPRIHVIEDLFLDALVETT